MTTRKTWAWNWRCGPSAWTRWVFLTTRSKPRGQPHAGAGRRHLHRRDHQLEGSGRRGRGDHRHTSATRLPASQVMMENVVMDGQPMMDAPKEYRPSEMGRAGGRGGLLAATAPTPSGYSLYYYVTEMYAREGVKLLAIDGVAPSQRSDRFRGISLYAVQLRRHPQRRAGRFPRAAALLTSSARRRARR